MFYLVVYPAHRLGHQVVAVAEVAAVPNLVRGRGGKGVRTERRNEGILEHLWIGIEKKTALDLQLAGVRNISCGAGINQPTALPSV